MVQLGELDDWLSV